MFAANGPESNDQPFTFGLSLKPEPVCSLIHREGFFMEECGTTGTEKRWDPGR